MQIKAIHKNARVSPRKLRPLAQMLRGLPVTEAEAQLRGLPSRKAADLVGSVLRSAVANATNNFEVDATTLRVAEVRVNAGLTFHRFQPVSRGMAHAIKKRTSHITVLLDTAGGKEIKRKKRKDEIETLSADQYVQHEHEHVEEKVAEAPEKTHDALETPVPEKEMEAFQKMKMQQQGGSKQKTHRRKSLSG